jgi:hypothetical protein
MKYYELSATMRRITTDYLSIVGVYGLSIILSWIDVFGLIFA